MTTNYAYPEKIVETDWVAKQLDNPNIRILECNEDVGLYKSGHIPGAVHLEWFLTLQHPVRRGPLGKEAFEKLFSSIGIANDAILVFYGDQNNWFATYALWLFEYYGHEDCRLMNGGRAKWEREGRPFTQEVLTYPKTTYRAGDPDNRIRAYREDVLQSVEAGKPLIDVRSPEEFSGRLVLYMPDNAVDAPMRSGHIASAENIPWSIAINEDTGTFKPASELGPLYAGHDAKTDDEVITYCNIGERSAHTWFVLKYLLGYPNVKNYDGSWAEWGNMVNVPIEW
jgi:thiosulfate/3-mercaptopyruvate sulfurtransferase